MMLDKRIETPARAVTEIGDGSTILISGFGEAGSPIELIHALLDQGATDLTVVANNAGNGHVGLAAMIDAGRVAKIVCSFPRSSDSEAFETAFAAGEIELEVVPQGTLAERIRAAGAGIPAFYTQTGVGTPLQNGKETRAFDDRTYVMEHAITADVALVKARMADRWGNLVYSKTARNFGPVMCMAAKRTIVQVKEVCQLGAIDPEAVVTPGIFVSSVVQVTDPKDETTLITQGMRRVPQ